MTPRADTGEHTLNLHFLSKTRAETGENCLNFHFSRKENPYDAKQQENMPAPLRQTTHPTHLKEATEAKKRKAVGKGALATAESKQVYATELTGNFPNFRFLSLRNTGQHLHLTQLLRDTFSTNHQTANGRTLGFHESGQALNDCEETILVVTTGTESRARGEPDWTCNMRHTTRERCHSCDQLFPVVPVKLSLCRCHP